MEGSGQGQSPGPPHLGPVPLPFCYLGCGPIPPLPAAASGGREEWAQARCGGGPGARVGRSRDTTAGGQGGSSRPRLTRWRWGDRRSRLRAEVGERMWGTSGPGLAPPLPRSCHVGLGRAVLLECFFTL